MAGAPTVASGSSPEPDSHQASESTPRILQRLAFAVLLSTSEGRDSRRLYLSLHSAERAAERAVELVLCALVPTRGA